MYICLQKYDFLSYDFFLAWVFDTDGQTDGKWCIRANRAWAQVGSKIVRSISEKKNWSDMRNFQNFYMLQIFTNFAYWWICAKIKSSRKLRAMQYLYIWKKKIPNSEHLWKKNKLIRHEEISEKKIDQTWRIFAFWPHCYLDLGSRSKVRVKVKVQGQGPPLGGPQKFGKKCARLLPITVFQYRTIIVESTIFRSIDDRRRGLKNLSIYLPIITSRQYWRWDMMPGKRK